MELIRLFSQISKADAALAGGKGASLGEMTQAGIPVPPGFVILAGTFEKFLEETKLIEEIDATLDKVKHEEVSTVEHASEKIQGLIHGAHMPEDIATAIKGHFKTLGAEFVAVRSSATAEDGATAAWAGQLDSYLNTTEATLLENVQRCWASLFTPRAIFYRFEKGLHAQKISVAVVVQKMVASDVSGIAFSVHPVTEDRNQLIIEAGFGLGEAIVSGQITPDSYVVEKEPRRIIDANISEQGKGLYRATHGHSVSMGGLSRNLDAPRPSKIEANEWRELGEKGKEQKLTNEQILELSELILKIENHYGFPCDIEWALEACPTATGGRSETFYITQSRPITTLSTSAIGASLQKVILHKVFDREINLFHCMLWANAVCKNSADWIDANITQQLFYCPKGDEIVSIWYEDSDIDRFFVATKKKVVYHPTFIGRLETYFRKHTQDSMPYYLGKTPATIEEMRSAHESMQYAFNGLAQVFDIIDLEGIPETTRVRALQLRTETQHLSKMIDKVWFRYLEAHHPELYKFRYVVGIEDLVRSPDLGLLEERLSGYGVYNAQVYSGAALAELLRSRLTLATEDIDPTITELRGTPAFKASAVQGKAVIITSTKQLEKMRVGDVLIVSATSPEYLPAMKKSVAIIANEGGITSHTAITARELKIPCIVGVRNATQIIKDGDLVEVDADRGVVKLLR